MAQASVSPLVLVILDGWGYREVRDGNAIAAAKTPVMDSLWAGYPSTLIRTSGKDVGLPEGQMGNSEVGHVNIGAGSEAGISSDLGCSGRWFPSRESGSD